MAILTSFFLPVAVAICVVYLIKKCLEWWKFVKRINLIPGPKHTFPFGVVLPLLLAKEEDYMEEFNKIADSYTEESGHGLLRIWVFTVPYVAFANAADAEILLKSTSEIRKSDDYRLLRSWLGDGLLTTTGSKWHAHRKMLTPSFHFQILENFMSIFNEQSQILVGLLAEKASKESFDISPYISLCTLDIICDSAMGKKIHAQTNSNSQYVNAVSKLTYIITKKFLQVWRTVPLIYFLFPDKWLEDHYLKVIHGFTNKVICERQAQRAHEKAAPSIDDDTNNNFVFGGKKRMAFLDTLLDAIESGQGRLTNEEIREEVDTFMFEGHDTTASALVSTIMHLALHQEVQQKALDELNLIFGDSNRPVELGDLSKMKYLEAIIKEVLRLNPPVPIYGRKLNEDMVVGGFTIPKGVRAMVNVRMVHRDPSMYKNPNDFDPSRFLKENGEQARHPYSFVPFSAGPRNCIGQKFAMMEEKVILTYILRNFKINGTWTEKQTKMSMALVSRQIKGLQVTLTKRSVLH